MPDPQGGITSKSALHPHVAGLILARGGSRGIPLKNVTLLKDTPLLAWSLSAMRTFRSFDSLWVSTDHPAIAGCARANGANVFPRSPKFATATSPSIDAVAEFLAHRPEVDIVGLVQCTSPFLKPEFLESAYNLMLDEEYDSVFSVTRDKKLRWSASDFHRRKEQCDEECDVSERGNSSPDPPRALNFNPGRRPRRQDWKGDLVENGMFYFARRSLVEAGVLQGGKCTFVEVPPNLSLEIDTGLDLALAEQIAAYESLEPYSSDNWKCSSKHTEKAEKQLKLND